MNKNDKELLIGGGILLVAIGVVYFVNKKLIDEQGYSNFLWWGKSKDTGNPISDNPYLSDYQKKQKELFGQQQRTGGHWWDDLIGFWNRKKISDGEPTIWGSEKEKLKDNTWENKKESVSVWDEDK